MKNSVHLIALALIIILGQVSLAQPACSGFISPRPPNRVLAFCYNGSPGAPFIIPEGDLDLTKIVGSLPTAGNGLTSGTSCSNYATLRNASASATDELSNSYYQLVVGVVVGFNLKFTNLQGYIGRDADGPKKLAIKYSSNNGATFNNLGSVIDIPLRTSCNAGMANIDLAGTAVNVIGGQQIIFRLYFYDAAAATGTCTLNNSAVFAEDFNPVPLELTSFGGQVKGTNHRLEWITLNERNVSHFDIEQSGDGTVFTTVGTVKAVGNSIEKQIYKFEQTPQYLTTFYRLRMVDLDGTTDFSKTISLTAPSKKASFKAFPNPTTDNLNVNFNPETTEEAALQVMDMVGRIVFTQKINVEANEVYPLSISTQNWAKGQYFITIRTSKGVLGQKIIK